MRKVLSKLAFAVGLDRREGTSTGTTRSEATKDTRVDLPKVTPPERRQSPRAEVKRPMILVPVLPNGGPDWEHRVEGATLDASPEGLGMLVDVAGELPTTAIVLLAPELNGTVRSVGLEVRHTRRDQATGKLWVGAEAGGYAAEVLDPENLTPKFCPHTMRFTWDIPEDTLRRWADVGVLEMVEGDRYFACPNCKALPTFRKGCRNCGSIRVQADQLVHHFACAHVGFLEEFASGGSLSCPKCHTRNLVIGSDYENMTGPYRCQSCRWSDAELEHVAQCLKCPLRFPGHQAAVVELKGFRANRLDLLALLPAP